MKFVPASIVVVIASFIIQSCLGSIYAWSVYMPPLIEQYGMPAAQLGLIFGLTITVFTISMVGSGRLLKIISPRMCSLICAFLFGSGYFFASFASGNFWILLLGAGIVSGAGIGLGYLSAIMVCIQWHPEKKGFITGIAVAGFGGGSIVASFIAQRLLDGGMDVHSVLLSIGGGSAIITAACALFMTFPQKKSTQTEKHEHLSAMQFILTPTFIALSLAMFAGTFSGLLLIANLKPLGLHAGFSSSQAMFAISAFAAGNISGRFLWGIFYDVIHWKTIPLSLLILSAASAALELNLPYGFYLLIVAIAGFSYGSNFVLYAAHIASRFGNERVNDYYPIVFLVYGVSGIVGPWVGGRVYDLTGSYASAIWICLAIALPCAFITAGLLLREAIIEKK